MMEGRRGVWIALAVLAAAFVALARWTWGAWPDPLVDFGRELYVPLRLSTGAVLGRDVAWFSGPLSQQVNALLFGIAGVSLTTLVAANLAVLALLALLWWHLLRDLAGLFAATVAVLVLLALFGFAQLVGIGNYNFVTPYSHEVTHGMLLATVALASLARFDARRDAPSLALAGLALGACLLTKVEVALAAGAAAALWLGALRLGPRGAPAVPRRNGAIFTAALGLPIALAFLWAALELGGLGALRLVFGGWLYALGGGAGELDFYSSGMGLDVPGRRLGELAAWSGRWALVLAPCAAAAWRLRRGSEAAHAASAAAVLAVGGLLIWRFRSVEWLAAARPLPLFVASIGGVAWTVLRRSEDDPGARRARAWLALSAFAFVLLLKMILNARVQHYGFALALPATLLTVAALIGVLPRELERRGHAGAVLRLGALMLFAVAAAAHLDVTRRFLAQKSEVVGRGGDAFRSDLRGRFVNAALEAYAGLAGPGDTLAVLPEGVMLNYLAGSANPTPYVNFMPPELLLFGEDRIVEAFQAAPPDWVFLVHKDTSEYGYPLFGPDYGTRLATWVQANYTSVRQFGQPPLTPGTVFGIQLMKRSTP